MNDRFTGGEWEQHGYLIFSPGEGVVCQLSEPRGSRFVEHVPVSYRTTEDRDEILANGNLIVAAPALLAAARVALRDLRSHMPQPGSPRHEIIVALEAAIAKAEHGNKQEL